MNGDEFWDELYKVDPDDMWANGAYDEYGNQVNCDWCGDPLFWNPESRLWNCRNCGKEILRIEWFNNIGASRVPGSKCLSQCFENYPVCKNWCAFYKIPDDDPML